MHHYMIGCFGREYDDVRQYILMHKKKYSQKEFDALVIKQASKLFIRGELTDFDVVLPKLIQVLVKKHNFKLVKFQASFFEYGGDNLYGSSDEYYQPKMALMRKEVQALHNKSSIYCNHANECPAVCPCDPDCYCKVHSCKE